MTRFRPRIWLGFGLSVLAVGSAVPSLAADPACQVPSSPSLGERGESGEGEGGPPSPLGRALGLDRMAAQADGAAAARAAGDIETTEILVGAATDEGPARLARRTGFQDPGLDAALARLAATPEDVGAARAALSAIEAALAAVPGTPVQRAAGLAALALEAFSAAQDCGRLADRAAYAEAGALARRARDLLLDQHGTSVREMTVGLERLAALLPHSPPDPLPTTGALSALVSQVQLAGSDAAR